jgi:cold-inducible RNA-binding protein
MLVPFGSTRKVVLGRLCPEIGLFCRSLVVGKKLYVGNLSYSVDGAKLEELFSQYGTVRSAEVVQDRDTGRSKGFGFVEMADDNSALEAISGLNDREQDGRRLTVNEARPKEPRSGGGGGYGGSRGGRSSSAYGGRR